MMFVNSQGFKVKVIPEREAGDIPSSQSQPPQDPREDKDDEEEDKERDGWDGRRGRHMRKDKDRDLDTSLTKSARRCKESTDPSR
jgi:hypothetical protein